MNDAGINYDAIQYATVGYVYGDSTAGQRVLYQLGMTQIPIINVNNNCSTGSTALYQARSAVASGSVDCAMALGFERMARGSLGTTFSDRTNPLGKIIPASIRFLFPTERVHFNRSCHDDDDARAWI